jgi:ribokinase
MSKVIVIGSCNTDMVIKSDRLPIPGETVIGGTFLMNAGGKGANQAVTAARQGGSVVFISKTGNDVFGKQSIELYKSEGINTDYIFSDPKLPSGVALIMVDAHGENCIAVASGANGSLIPADIEKAKAEIESANYVLMQLEIPIETVEYAAAMASAKGIPVILNPAPARALPDTLLKSLFLVTPNESEAEILSGIKVFDWESARQAANVISAKGVDNVVITMGSMGLYQEKISITLSKHLRLLLLIPRGRRFFSSALVVGLSEGKSILESVKAAAKVAALTVTRMGAQSSIPYRNELSLLESKLATA